MSQNYLPPQAYTKETLAKAFTWLQGQPDNIQALAANPDALVGMYMKSRRGGSLPKATVTNADAPVSSEKFRSHLKDLATELQQFSTPEAKQPAAESRPSANDGALDFRSMSMVIDVRDRLNLSSDQEAIRALITLGFAALGPILPKAQTSTQRDDQQFASAPTND